MPTLGRIRAWTAFLIFGLVLSGASALPIQTEVRAGIALLGANAQPGASWLPPAVAGWLLTLRDGIADTAIRAPFMFYGTDWLAFGHFVIAIAFVGALRDPVRNRWLYEFGMIAAALVPVWATVWGALRGIPAWWRLVDASFGIGAFVPAFLCFRWTGILERMAVPPPSPPSGL